MTGEGTQERPGMSRRRMLGFSGASLLVGAAAGAGLDRVASAEEDDAGDAIAFHGAHQAGIATPVQDRLHFAAFDVTTGDRDRLVRMLKEWTAAAAAMTAGRRSAKARSAAPRSRRPTTPARRSGCLRPGSR
ncbi:Dyp-type peroxidase domain-containing protein [Actinomadura luteofluorescens]|uniref:Dyp-type peroxidase domain-containing protein n=1 Tax=Actinomadura luteofluorescens TaxID=46163 RepID=UPI003634840A